MVAMREIIMQKGKTKIVGRTSVGSSVLNQMDWLHQKSTCTAEQKGMFFFLFLTNLMVFKSEHNF